MMYGKLEIPRNVCLDAAVQWRKKAQVVRKRHSGFDLHGNALWYFSLSEDRSHVVK